MDFWRKVRNLMLLILAIGVVLATVQYLHTWPLRFRRNLDAYFGKENWEWVSQDRIEDYRYDIYQRVPNHSPNCFADSGKHHIWYIAFRDPDGQRWMWRMTDHAYYVTMQRSGAISGFSAIDGLTAELRDLAFKRGCHILSQKYLSEVLSQEELNCLHIEVSYRGGNLGHALYKELRQQPWFDSGHMKEYLNWNFQDFYLLIYPYNHRVERLSPETRAHLFSSLPQVEAVLRQALGEEYCDYKIQLGQDAQENPVYGEHTLK